MCELAQPAGFTFSAQGLFFITMADVPPEVCLACEQKEGEVDKDRASHARGPCPFILFGFKFVDDADTAGITVSLFLIDVSERMPYLPM